MNRVQLLQQWDLQVYCHFLSVFRFCSTCKVIHLKVVHGMYPEANYQYFYVKMCIKTNLSLQPRYTGVLPSLPDQQNPL